MASFKMFFGIFVIAASVYLGAKIVPPYFENYQFQDAIKNEATLDTYTPKTEDDIRKVIFRKAQELEIPIHEEGIKVQRQGSQFAGVVSIRANYVVHIDLPGYPVDLNFDASTENKSVF
jgi:hypothetical protein